MAGPNVRTRWRAYLYRTKVVSSETVVFLLALSEDMDAKGFVEVERPEIATRLRLSERVVSKRLKAACDALVLDRYRTGGNGRKAAYIALVPDEVAGTYMGAQLPRVAGTYIAPQRDPQRSHYSEPDEILDTRATRGRAHAHHLRLTAVRSATVSGLQGRHDDGFRREERTTRTRRRSYPSLASLVEDSNPSSTRPRPARELTAVGGA